MPNVHDREGRHPTGATDKSEWIASAAMLFGDLRSGPGRSILARLAYLPFLGFARTRGIVPGVEAADGALLPWASLPLAAIVPWMSWCEDRPADLAMPEPTGHIRLDPGVGGRDLASRQTPVSAWASQVDSQGSSVATQATESTDSGPLAAPRTAPGLSPVPSMPQAKERPSVASMPRPGEQLPVTARAAFDATWMLSLPRPSQQPLVAPRSAVDNTWAPPPRPGEPPLATARLAPGLPTPIAGEHVGHSLPVLQPPGPESQGRTKGGGAASAPTRSTEPSRTLPWRAASPASEAGPHPEAEAPHPEARLAASSVGAARIVRTIHEVVEKTVTEQLERRGGAHAAPRPPRRGIETEVYDDSSVRRLMAAMRRIEQNERLRGGRNA